MIGPPLAGSLFDFTGSYDVPFFLSGAMLVVSGIMSFFIPYVRNTAQKLEVVQDFASPLEEIPEESDVEEEDEDAENVVDNVETVV